MDRVEQLLAAGRREWSDELEAVSGLLGAAGVWEMATARRRVFARQLLARKVTSDDVLTWALHGLRTGHGPGWLVRALEADPETIFKARSKGAKQQVAGPVNWIRKQQVEQLVAHVLGGAVARVLGEKVAAVEPRDTVEPRVAMRMERARRLA